MSIQTINHSAGFPNWTQRNDKASPYTECGEAASTNSLQSCGYLPEKLASDWAKKVGRDPTIRPDDALYYFVNSDPDCLALRDKRVRQAALDPNYPPNQIMEVLALGLGKWVGNRAKIEFHYGLPLYLIAQHIIEGGCAIVHGHYPDPDAKEGYIDHFSALVGLIYDDGIKGLPGVHAFIDDDSWGNPMTQYKSQMGDNIVVPLSNIQSLLKDTSDPLHKDAILVYRA